MALTITRKVGTRGEIVLPKPIREALGLTPGREVNISIEKDEARIKARRSPEQFRKLMEEWKARAAKRGPPEPWLLDSNKAYEERFKHGRDTGLS